ncbi:MAG: DMT family transporter [bacterium]|nr:DMT family transporter [bacterium]
MQKLPVFSGAFYMLAGIFILSCANVFVKTLSESYDIFQIIFFRSIFSVPFLWWLLKKNKTFSAKRPIPQKGRLLFIAAISPFALWCLFSAFRELPIANAQSLSYASTLFITILSPFVLKEHVGWYRWSAAGLGFTGVLVLTQPTGDFAMVGVFYALSFAGGDALVALNLRLFGKAGPSTLPLLASSIGATLVAVCVLPWVWITPSLTDFSFFVVVGVLGPAGLYGIMTAYQIAPPASVAPLIYSGLLWGASFDILFWNHVPTTPLLIGSVLIISAALFILYRERALSKKHPLSKQKT